MSPDTTGAKRENRPRGISARFAQRGHGRQLGLAQKVVRPRQQQGDGAGLLHGIDASVRKMLQMVAAQRLVMRGQGSAFLVAQLLGVQLHGQA